MVFLAVGVAFLMIFAVLFRRDSRAWTNGVPLLLGLCCLALGVLNDPGGLLGTHALGLVLILGVLCAPFAFVGLLAFLLVNGVQMMRREGRSAGNLLSLALGLALCALVAASILIVVWGSQRLFILIMGVWLVVGYLAMGFTAYLLISFIYGRRRVQPGAHALIVLGAGIPGGRVTPLLARRLDRAADQLAADRAAGFESVIIPSGGQGTDEPRPEGDAMAEYLVGRGVPPDRIRVEDRARTTRENLLLSQLLVPRTEPTELVVTSQYHAMRAASLARELNVPAHVVGAPTAFYFLPSALLREYAALLARHRLLHLFVCVALLAMAGAVAAQL